MRYSLSDYKLSITLPTNFATAIGIEQFTIGGEGSYLGKIDITQEKETYTTEGSADGSWWHNKSLDRHGKVSIEINQLAGQIVRLRRIFSLYFQLQDDYDGMTMVLTDRQNNIVCTMNDCFITKPADLSFADTAANQTWEITCGRISQ